MDEFDVDVEVKQLSNAEAQPHRFVWRFQLNEEKSHAQGRPIYDPVVFLEVISAEGEVRDIKYVRANDFHKRKFPTAWKKFRDNIAPEVDMGMRDPLTVYELRQMFPDAYEKYCARCGKQEGGTLLCEWNQCPGSLALELKYCGVFTVEDVIDSVDNEVIPEWLKDAAIQYVAQSQNAGHVNTLAKALIKAKAHIDRQNQIIASLRQNN